MKIRVIAIVLFVLCLSACGNIKDKIADAVADAVGQTESQPPEAQAAEKSGDSGPAAVPEAGSWTGGPDDWGNSVGNVLNQGFVAGSGDWIYYINIGGDEKLYAIRADGSDRQLLSDEEAFFLNVAGDRVYYVNCRDFRICSIRIDGSDRQVLSDDEAANVILVGDRLYYVNYTDGRKIYTMKLDGSDRQKLNDDESSNVSLVGDRIYYNAWQDDEIIYFLYTMKTDGSDLRKIDYNFSNQIIAEGDRIFYLDGVDSVIYSTDTDGGDRRVLESERTMSINVTDGRIYYSSWADNGNIYSMKTDGSDRKQLSNDAPVHGDEPIIAVIGDRLYFVNGSDGWKIYSMRLDGSDRRPLDGSEAATAGDDADADGGTEQEIALVQWMMAGKFSFDYDMYFGDESDYEFLASGSLSIDGDNYAARMDMFGISTRIIRTGGRQYSVDDENKLIMDLTGMDQDDFMSDDYSNLVFSSAGTGTVLGKNLPYQRYTVKGSPGTVTYYLDGKDVYGIASEANGFGVLLIIKNVKNSVPGGVFDLPSGYMNLGLEDYGGLFP